MMMDLRVHLRTVLVLAGRRRFQEPLTTHLHSSINELVHKACYMALKEWLQLLDQGLFHQPTAAQTSNDIGLQHILVPQGSPKQLRSLLAHPGPQWTEDIWVVPEEGHPFLRQDATHCSLGHWLSGPLLFLVAVILGLCTLDNLDLQKVIFQPDRVVDGGNVLPAEETVGTSLGLAHDAAKAELV